MNDRRPIARTRGQRLFVIVFLSLITFASGLLNLLSTLTRFAPLRTKPLVDLFPLELLHVPRLLTVLTGFALTMSSVNILRRKHRAFVLVSILAAASVVLHLARGGHGEEAALSALLVLLLLAARREFTVASGVPELRPALVKLGAATAVVLAYGIIGFWLLDPRDLGLNFHFGDAARMTVEYLSFQVDPYVMARTRHGVMFLDSLGLITIVAIAYSTAVLFAPAAYRLSTQPRDRAAAGAIVARYGRSALDYFKSWPDKSLFFTPSMEAFVAYRVGAHHAIALGDPVGPGAEIEETIGAFRGFCEDRDWRVAFHQVLPDFLDLYRRQGFKRLRIGDDAVVDLDGFTLQGRDRKELRHVVGKLDRGGVTTYWCDPPLTRDVLAQVKEVSDEWLRLDGRRERQFTLGFFDPDYIAGRPLFVSRDAQGRALAFVNIVPSFHAGEAAIDLMRRRPEAPNGIMDHLFVKLFAECRERGYHRFNLGMAPMAGFGEHEEASREERALHTFFQQLNFLFHYRGLRRYKAKFASSWEPRYLMYRNVLDLPSVALAIGAVTAHKA